jgi:hypothetical protein
MEFQGIKEILKGNFQKKKNLKKIDKNNLSISVSFR